MDKLNFKNRRKGMPSVGSIALTLVIVTAIAWLGTPASQALVPNTVQISKSSGGGCDVVVTGVSGQSWRLLTSTNLTTWQPLATNQIGSGGTALYHVTYASGLRRFYRAQLLTSVAQSGRTVTALSASYTDVTAAMAQAVDGDTVLVPVGSATWGQTLNITKAITLMGAGTNLTRITSGIPWDGSTSIAIIKVQLPADKPVRISNIYFDNVFDPVVTGPYHGYQTPHKSAIWVNGRDYNGNGVAMTQVRIDNNHFNKGKMSVRMAGYVYGVIDHNTFVNGDIEVGLWADDNYSWQRPIVAGTQNAMFIEDNRFIVNNNADYQPNENIYHQQGARSVIRNNTFDSTAYTSGDTLFVDSHGYFGCCRGQPMIEIYNNTFNGYQTYRGLNLRGGTVIVHDNTMGNSVATIQLRNEGMSTWGTYSPTDEIKNSHFWNNKRASGATIVPNIESGSEPYVVLGANYFNRAPQSGDASYPYTPYTYPHPLVTGSTAPPPPPPPPNTTTYTVRAADLWDNGYNNVATPRQSVHSRFVFTTTAPSITVNGNTTDYTGHPQWAHLGVRINGVDQIPTPIAFSANGDQNFTVNLGTAGTSRTVEIIAGFQSNPSHPTQSGVMGSYINSVTYPNSYTLTVQPPVVANRVLIYGDSITGGASATYPEYQGYPALLRKTYGYSVAVDAWGYRSLYDDANTPTLRNALVSHLASYNPSTIVMAIGANDYGLANEWNAANFGTAYAAVLDSLHASLPSARIICVTPFVERTETANSYGNTLSNYRAQISAACNARAWTQLVDGSSILTVADLDLNSSVHPSTAGQAKIAAALALVLR